MSLCRILSTIALGAPAALLAGCDEAPVPPPRVSVVLVTLDTTRADYLGQYGNPDVHTPTLDAWARGGAVADQAIADVPLTLPSHVTIFTGTPALHHGVRTNADFRLSDAAPTLAERFAEEGYRTAAIVSSVVLAKATGIAQGFDAFDDDLTSPYVMQNPALFPETTHWIPDVDRRADEALNRALDVLREIAAGDAPFFLWLHLYDPHFPYDAPPPWNRVQADPYGAEIEFVDRQLARLRRALVELDEGAVLVVTSDHGEGLDDHGEDEHGILLYDEALRVPLLVSGPGVTAGTLLDGQVRTVDLAATLLELAGLSTSFGAGGSLGPALRGEGRTPGIVAYGETIKPRVAYSGSAVKTLRTRYRKLIWAPRPELYDLVADPGETNDLSDERPREVEELTEHLEDFIRAALGRRVEWAGAPEVDDERLEALASLGYVAAAPGARPARNVHEEMEVFGFDPKDLVDVVMAGRDVENGFHARARRKLERFVRTADSPEERPEIRPLWSLAQQNLGAIARAAGEFDAAATAFREALRHQPLNAAARWELIMSLNLGGRAAEAEQEARRLLGETPNAWRVRLHRGLALALLGRTAEAREELAAVARDCPDAETRRVAELFASKVGTDEQDEALGFYLGSWRRGR